MACAHPLHPPYPTYYVRGQIYTDTRPLQVPCGWCVNCRRDKQNFYIDRANYEYSKRITGAFVTFTYDTPHLIEHCGVTDGFGKLIFDVGDDGQRTPRTSLNYKDFTRFIDRIRHYIVDHEEIQGVLCQPDFSYLYCGEYGELGSEHNNNGRPHFHCLFFGLDFAFCKKIIFESWKYGFIDVLPILDGGIRYVTGYMDKFVSGDAAFWQYDAKCKARPRLRASVGFGQGLLWDNVDDIYANYFTYQTYHNLRRPISTYWKRLVTGGCLSRDPTRSGVFETNPAYKAYKMIETAQRMISANLHRRVNVYSESEQTQFKLRQAKIREYNLITQIRADGNPVSPPELAMSNKFGWVGYNHEKVRRLPTASQRLLADQYRASLESRWLYLKFPDLGVDYEESTSS